MKRILILTLLLTLLLALPASADESGVFCGDLPASDCQLLQDAAANMDALSSFAFDMHMTLAFDDGAESMEAALGATGSLALSPESLAAAKSAAEMAEASETVALDEEMAGALDGLIAGLSGMIDLDIALDDEAFAMSLLMQDGVLVLDMAALGALMGEDGGDMDGMESLGLDANGIFSYMVSQPDMADLMSHGDMDGASLEDASVIRRLPDSEIGGASVAVFESEIGSSALIAGIGAEVAKSAAGGESQDLDSMTLVMREYISLDDRHTHRVEAEMDLAGELAFSMRLRLDMSGFNQPVAVALPEDVMAFPLAMMLQMMAAQADG